MGMGAKKRKIQSTLYNSGLAFIVLGFWTAIKESISLFLDYGAEIQKEIHNLLLSMDTEFVADELRQVESIVYIVLVVLILGVAALVLLIHFFLGRAAMQEAKGKKKKIVYLVFACIYLVFNVFVYVYGIVNAGEAGMMDYSELIVDLTVYFACIMIIKSSIELRRIQKQENAAVLAA